MRCVFLLSREFAKFCAFECFGLDYLAKKRERFENAVLEQRFADIRDRGVEFYDSSNVGYEELYLVSRDGHDDPERGITVSKQFYVRVLYDEKRHNWVAVASPHIDALHRQNDEATDQHYLAKVNDDHDIYILGAWTANLSGEELRNNVKDKLRFHRDLAMMREQFYMDATPVDEKNLDNGWGIRTVNSRLGFLCQPLTVHEENPPPEEKRQHS